MKRMMTIWVGLLAISAVFFTPIGMAASYGKKLATGTLELEYE